MKIWHSPTSPYTRKVKAVAAHHDIELEWLAVVKNSFNPASPHNLVNPLGKVPVLQTENGDWLYDSSVIAEYLDNLGKAKKLYPHDETRWQVLNVAALANGILDNNLTLLLPEKLFRPQNEWWTARHEQITQRNRAALPQLAKLVQDFDFELNIATINAVCAVDYLLFRDEMIGAGDAVRAAQLDQWAAKMNKKYACLRETMLQAA